MATAQNSSSIISNIYKSRKTLLELTEIQDYNTESYKNFSINEVNSMYQNKQLDMLLEKITPDVTSTTANKIYIRYYLGKTIGRQNIQEMIDDLYNIEEVLTKNDILFIVIKNNINDTIRSVLTHIWETEGIYVIVQSIKNLQFNILQHELVPPHRIMNDTEVNAIKTRFNIMSDEQFPEISRFDPVAQATFMKPGQVCEIIRPSKTTINSYYYRICV